MELGSAGLRGESLPSDNHFLNRLKLEFAYFGGQAWQSREIGGAGVILRLQRVIPRRAGRFQPLKSSEITPRFLDRMVRALKRWKYDLVNMDEAGRAGTTAAAFGDDAGNVVAQGRFHHCRTELSFYGVLRPIVFDVGDLGHSRHAEFLLQACR